MPILSSMTYKITMACGHTAERTWAASTQSTHAAKIKNLETETCWACRQASMQSEATLDLCESQEALFLKMVGRPLPAIRGVSEKQLIYSRLLRARAFESVVKVFQSPWAAHLESVQKGIVNHYIIQEMLVMDEPATLIELCHSMPADNNKLLEDLRKECAKKHKATKPIPTPVELAPNIFGATASA